jgi:hypothetical protein
MHKLITLKYKNTIIKLLGERHIKTNFEKTKCDEIIKVPSIKYFLIECPLNSTFSNIFYKYFYMLLGTLTKITGCYNNESTINHIIHNNYKKIYSLESDYTPHILDHLNIKLFCLNFFIESLIKVFPKIESSITRSITTFIIAYFVLGMLIHETPLNYGKKKKISEYIFIETHFHRRNTIMSNNIIKYIESNKENDVIMCVFGSLHFEGILYNLLEKGACIIDKQIIF